jgi:zinc transport system substrate-binding protein
VGVILAGVLAVGACSSGKPNASQPGRGGTKDRNPTIVASFYPLAFVTERLVGDVATIINLTPPGVEPHDLEVTPDQAGTIEDANLVVMMGQGLQPSVEDAAKRRNAGVLSLLDALGVTESKAGGRTNDTYAYEGSNSESDPHIWLDPQLMENAVAEIATALAKVFPDSIDDINARSTDLGAELSAIDSAYATGLAGCKGRVLISTHAAFGRLAKRYGLVQESIVGLSPEAEPTADRLAALADLVAKKQVKTIFTETLVSKKVAETLAREAGVAVAVLDPIESAPNHGDYLDAMVHNLEVLRSGLGC